MCSGRMLSVLLPYRFTLFSNQESKSRLTVTVLLPYRFTLFSNTPFLISIQFAVLLPYRFTLFSNWMPKRSKRFRFYYLIDLHYSQTMNLLNCKGLKVLLPYRFTLFSNSLELLIIIPHVLLPYRFTLFSNLKLRIKCTHYTVHGKSIGLFYNICITIVNKIRTNHYQSQQVFRIQKLLSVLSFQC